MTIRAALVATLLAACTAQTPHDPITATEFCERFGTTITHASEGCCGTLGPAPDVTDFMGVCTRQFVPLLDDPRVGLNEAAAWAFLDESERRLATCDGDWSAWAVGPMGVRTIFAGTRAIGTDCSPTDIDDIAAAYSCIGGYCPVGRTGAVDCLPYVVEGGMCTSYFDCAPGLYCTAGATGSTGACARPQANGATCGGANECVSGLCFGGVCTQPAAMRPQSLCLTMPPPAADRDVDLSLTGFMTSPTRDVTLRVLDATNAQVVIYRATGLSDATSMHHIPRAIPSGTAYTAQIWTSDAASPSPEMRSWEVPIAPDGAIAIAIGWDDATTPMTRMPPSSMDTLFELELFAFDAEVGKTFELRVVLSSTLRTVAQTRIAAVPDIDFTVDLADCVTPTQMHRFAMYVDENGDGAYEAPPIDHAWTASAIAPPTGGLSLPYMWSSAYQDVHY